MKTLAVVWSLDQTRQDFFIVDVLARVRHAKRLVGAYTIGASRRFGLGLELGNPLSLLAPQTMNANFVRNLLFWCRARDARAARHLRVDGTDRSNSLVSTGRRIAVQPAGCIELMNHSVDMPLSPRCVRGCLNSNPRPKRRDAPIVYAPTSRFACRTRASTSTIKNLAVFGRATKRHRVFSFGKTLDVSERMRPTLGGRSSSTIRKRKCRRARAARRERPPVGISVRA